MVGIAHAQAGYGFLLRALSRSLGGHMDIFVDMHQYGKIAQANAVANDAKDKVGAFDHRLAELERNTDRLSLACQALWELLKERTQLTEEDMFTRMEQIDMRDGKRDGKIGGHPMICAGCGRTINTKRPTCIYCGLRNAINTVV